MPTNFPGALDNNTTLPNPGSGSFTNNPTHAGQHDNENDAIKALEAKVGTGASTPVASQVFRGTGTGTSAWGQLVLTTDVSGILPAANGGTGIGALATGVATFLGTPSSANLLAAMTTKTGTGSLVFATSPTLTTPAIADFTSAAHNHSNAAGGGALGNATVTPSMLTNSTALGAVATAETTTSSTYVDLTTTTDSATVIVGTNGVVLVTLGDLVANNTVNAFTFVSVAVSGANTIAANDTNAIMYQAYGANAQHGFSGAVVFTGLTPGSTTFKMKYRNQTGGGGAGTSTHTNRRISATPL